MQEMLLEVLHCWCPLRAAFFRGGFRVAHGLPATAVPPGWALLPAVSAQLSLKKVFLSSRQTLSTDTSRSITLSQKASCCPGSCISFPSSVQSYILRTSPFSHLPPGDRENACSLSPNPIASFFLAPVGFLNSFTLLQTQLPGLVRREACNLF